MKGKIITGVSKDMETGEKTEMEHYAFFPNYEMTTIIRVKEIECFDDPPQIDITCKALDSIGMVFDLTLIFMPESPEEKDGLLIKILAGSCYLVSGKYGFVNKASAERRPFDAL